MNKLSVGLLLAAGLFFIDVTPAAAHHRADNARVHEGGYHVQWQRRHEMPRWLRRNRDFRHWWERRYFERRYFANVDHHPRRDHDHDRDRRGNRRDD